VCVVGLCKIAACSRIFGQNTKSLIILSTATGENRFVLQWYFGYAISSNLTFFAFAYTHIGGWTGGRVPLSNWSGASIVSSKFVLFVKTLSRLFCVLLGALSLQPFPNPGRSAGRARQRREERREEEGKKGKGRDRRRSNGLAPRKQVALLSQRGRATLRICQLQQYKK